uniref:TOG domain-containing protein n=1 Tax=Mola mola TaxID=94237 RepID=A0A3Q3VUZ0_MOLML
HYSCRSQTQILEFLVFLYSLNCCLLEFLSLCHWVLFQVFDAFKARLQESNSKVNLYALESLLKIIPSLKDNLSQVVNILVPAIVDNHLNSKNSAIYSAAIRAINALTLHLDNILLLQPLCTKAQFLNGKAKVDLVEKVAELYPRKPQMVEQKVLPLLWHLLGTPTHSGIIHGRGSSVRGATVNLCQALHAQMGPSLVDLAACQSASVHKSLNELLRTFATSRSPEETGRLAPTGRPCASLRCAYVAEQVLQVVVGGTLPLVL